jgi:hypothetical protein
MTEAEWLACTDPKKMLDFLGKWANKRRLRLFAVACARDLFEHNPDPNIRGSCGDIRDFAASILRAEAYADGQGLLQYMPHAEWVEYPDEVDAAYVVVGIDADTHIQFARVEEAVKDFRVNPAHWIRCIFVNPYRFPRTVPPAVLAWNDRTISRIAEAIYEERKLPEGTFDTARMAILANALLDAGCEDEGLLAHLRSEGPHVRGCWVVDSILGKA